jgi:putative FmdB family regulatory protein
MIYEYYCHDCQYLNDVEKKAAEIDRLEYCADCGSEMQRQLSASVSFQGEKTGSNEAYFNHALGCVVKGDKHAREIAKQRGLIEIGNEKQNHLTPKEESYELSDYDYHDAMGVGELRSLEHG